MVETTTSGSWFKTEPRPKKAFDTNHIQPTIFGLNYTPVKDAKPKEVLKAKDIKPEPTPSEKKPCILM